MWPYWLMFSIPALFALREVQEASLAGRPFNLNRQLTPIWWVTIVVLTLLIGFRHEVGGDWGNYLRHFFFVDGFSLLNILEMGDPGYQFLNWINTELGFGIYGVNLMGGAVFSVGLARLCCRQQFPWLALTIAIPYLVIVVAMGYSRQAIALGCAMIGLVALMQGRNAFFVFWLLIGATMHKTAILLLPMVALATVQNRFATALLVAVAVAIFYQLLLSQSVDLLVKNYVEAAYQSEGAFVRLAMNALPAGIFLALRKSFDFSKTESRLWLLFSLFSMFLFALYFVTDATTALDRMGLYMLPLQLVIWGNLPQALGRFEGSQSNWSVAVVGYTGAVLFVWLNFAAHSYAWLPYQFFPVVEISEGLNLGRSVY